MVKEMGVPVRQARQHPLPWLQVREHPPMSQDFESKTQSD